MVGVRQFDERQVLARALDLFWRQGLHATSMLDLAAATGVQRNSLYNAYGDKESLFLLAFETYAESVLESVRKAFADPDPARALTKFLEVGIVKMAHGVPPRGCLTTKAATEPDVIDTAIQRRLQDLLNETEAIAAKALSSEEARSRLVLSPKMTADVVVTFSRGLAVMERVYQDSQALRRSARALVRSLVRDKRRRRKTK